MLFTKIKEKVNRWHFLILAVIFVIAFMMRIVGANWGMPHNNLHPDEGFVYSPAYTCALERNFEVHEYYRPNHVSIKLNTLLYIAIQDLYFAPQGMEDFSANFYQNFSLFMTASRILTAIISMGTVVFAYLISRAFGKNVALLATFLFAVFSSFIEHSHYLTPDIPLLFFLMGVLWAALCYMRKPSKTWIFWMSFFTALAACEKYPGLYGCVIIAVVVCMTYIKKPLMIIRDGFLAILFVVLGIMAVSPVLIVDLETVLEVMEGQNKQYHIGADGLNFGQTLLFYLKTMAVRMGLILSVSSIYGVVRSFMKNNKITVMLLVFFAYIIPISTLSVHWERYALLMYAIGLIFGAAGIIYLIEDLQKVLQKDVVVACVVYFVLLILPAGSVASTGLAVTANFLAPDNRIFLQEAISEMGVSDSNTVYDCNTPLDPGGFYGAWCNFNGSPKSYKYGGNPSYVMTSSAQRDLYLEADPDVYGWIAQFYNELDEEHQLIAIFTAENPTYHIAEVQNIWYAARSVYRYMKGSPTGFEIRLYQIIRE